MNKLVSKNPVLRFKQGKLIVKARNGLLFIYYKGRDGKDYEAWRGGNDWYYRQKGTTEMTRMPYNYITTTGLKFYNSTSKGAVANTYDVVNNMSNQPKKHIPLGGVLAMRLKYLGKFNIDVAKEETHNYLEGLRNKYVRPFKNNSPTKTITPVNNYYLKGFENRKAELAQQGKTVRDIQKMLGFTGKDLDGKWGQNTEDAYNVWLNQLKTNQEVPIVEKPADIAVADAAYDKSKNNAVYSFSGKTLPTPDYGYYSPSNYGTLNPRWLKTAGATNIEGFRNLVNNNNLLKQDLLNRYGENWEQHLFNAAGVNANKRHFGRKSRRLINEALQNTVDTLNNNYMDKVRAYDQQYGLYKQGGQLVSRNPIIRFKNKKK